MLSNKVLIAIPCLLLGGTEYQTLNLVKALKESGYDVKVLCYFEYDDRMLTYMNEAGAEVLLMTKSGIRPSNFLSKISALFLGFRSVLQIYKPNIVHVQYMAPGSLAILLFKLLGVKKVLATAHVPGHIYKNKSVPKFIAKYMTDSFLCVSKSSEEAFFETQAELFSKEQFDIGRKHFTIYNCVELSPNYAKISHQKNECFTIGIVSRLSFEKGIDIMISAMPMLLQTYPNIKLLIVGEGVEKDNLVNLSEKLDVAHTITWAGLQPKDKLMDYYEQMDLVVVPSRFEGFGLTAIEAMSFSIPVVASAVDGLKEVVEDGKSGVLFQSEDSNALSDTILSLMKDDMTLKNIAISGKKRVQENFSYDTYKEKINELYSVLSKDLH